MKFLKIIFLLYTLTFIISCGGIKEVFTNQKKNSSDEFLVEKKTPLVMPPDYNDLPVPNTDIVQNDKSENEIKNLLKTENKSVEHENSNQTLEETLIKKIKNN